MSEAKRGGFDPDWTIAPGETLEEWLEENRLSVRGAVSLFRMGAERLQRIIDGKQRITTGDAERLAAGTGIPVRLWLKLERRYREDLLRGKFDMTRGGSGE